jgi:hypothetical protein
MDIPALIKKLSQLQLEQNKIIEQITAARATATPTEPEDTIHIGDHVLLLTGGIRCIKGDRARVTKVTNSAVHFTVIRNKHNTYKKHRNVRKIVE